MTQNTAMRRLVPTLLSLLYSVCMSLHSSARSSSREPFKCREELFGFSRGYHWIALAVIWAFGCWIGMEESFG